MQRLCGLMGVVVAAFVVSSLLEPMLLLDVMKPSCVGSAFILHWKEL